MPCRLKAGLCVAAVCAAAVCCAVWWLWPWAAPAVSGSPADSRQGPALLDAAPPAAATPDTAPAQDERAPGLDELRELCGQPWLGAFGPACLAALERRHAATPAVPDTSFNGTAPVDTALFGPAITWGEVFEDAGVALERVEAAMARPECRPAKRSLRLDLRNVCAADDMARLAILQSECEMLLFGLGYSDRLSPTRWRDERAGANNSQALWRLSPAPPDDGRRERAEIDGLERRQRMYANFPDHGSPADAAEHQRRRDQMDERWYGAMWRAGKCRALPPHMLTALEPSFLTRGVHGFPCEHWLIEPAARLGSEWAISAALNGGMLTVDERSLARWQAERPALVELLRMWNFSPYHWNPQTMTRREAKTQMIAHAIAALALGGALGVDIRQEPVDQLIRSTRFRGPTEGGRITQADIVASIPHGARRLIELGWVVVVHGGDDDERLYAHVDDVRDSDPWWAEGHVSLRRGAGTGTASAPRRASG